MEKIILFGAGKDGKSVYEFLQQRGEGNLVVCFCDNNKDLWGMKIGDAEVYSYEACKKKQEKFVIASTRYAEEIKNLLLEDNMAYYMDISEWALSQEIDMVKWNRDYCAWFHIHSMDNYFDKAELDCGMNVFWNEDTVFYKMFCKLDLSNVIELAVEIGRAHV